MRNFRFTQRPTERFARETNAQNSVAGDVMDDGYDDTILRRLDGGVVILLGDPTFCEEPEPICSGNRGWRFQ